MVQSQSQIHNQNKEGKRRLSLDGTIRKILQMGKKSTHVSTAKKFLRLAENGSSMKDPHYIFRNPVTEGKEKLINNIATNNPIIYLLRNNNGLNFHCTQCDKNFVNESVLHYHKLCHSVENFKPRPDPSHLIPIQLT